MPALPIAVSLGDPSGIGPDIILTATANNSKNNRLPEFYVIGDPLFLAQRAKTLGINIDIVSFGDTDNPEPDVLKVLDCGYAIKGVPGDPDTNDAKATILAIDIAVEHVLCEKASAIVTCPINKDVLYQAGFGHPGHTEYLGALAEQHTGSPATPVMMLAGPQLRTVPVTIHIALSQVQKALTREAIIETASIVATDLTKRFGIREPRLAVSGLNPHAGENGNMGREEIETIQPAIETLQACGINAFGPLPADTMFHQSARKNYDAAICMYHDQALIPAKMLGFDDAVNVTLGLPFIRTSPDHGTAYDISGTGKANPSSFIAALNMAAEMAG